MNVYQYYSNRIRSKQNVRVAQRVKLQERSALELHEEEEEERNAQRTRKMMVEGWHESTHLP